MTQATREQRETFRKRREAIAAEVAEKDERGKPKWTYDEIGERHGITRERVRQIAVLFNLERRKARAVPA